MNTFKSWSRRDFLRSALASAAGLSTRGSALGFLAATHAAATEAATTDYKALVCIFLSGGNDGFNVLIPSDDTRYVAYKKARANLALPPEKLLSLAATSSTLKYSVPSYASGLRDLYSQGQLAFVANVGTLLEATTKKTYQEGKNLPPQLYSHNDQSDQAVSAQLDAAQRLGWGGRIADLMSSRNGASRLPLGISIAGNTLFQVGETAVPYNLSSYGAKLLRVSSTDPKNSRYNTFNKLLEMAATDSYLLKRQLANSIKGSIDLSETLIAALANSSIGTGIWPASRLSEQLQMVAKMISVRQTLGMSRQVFYVVQGGYDTHYNQLELHAQLIKDLSDGLTAFHGALNELGVGNNVSSFTLSDFGRTLTSNGSGTDHAWGNVNLVAGGAVAGGNVYGKFPSQVIDSANDAGYGRIIPTTSIDQYAATLASWFGVDAAGLQTIFPNLTRFPVSNLGFMR
jgi:uncharacterized protein (DUF1501 family)